MSDLKRAEFQEAAVQLICERLTDRSGSRRFLLADEVGLGKTIVARGVVEELLRRKRGLDVVYLCSNAEIAEQNRKRLDPAAQRPLRRVTELAYGTPERRDLRVFSFTPGTSLSAGTGLAWERRLLLYVVFRVLRQDIRKGNWRAFFRCGAGEESWMRDTRFRALSAEFHRKLSRSFQQLVAQEWRRKVQLFGGDVAPADVLERDVQAFRHTDPESRRRRNQLVAALRVGVQRVALDDLSPDLVILDEVQRFRSVLQEADSVESIAARLFRKGAAVLILSATPYRMLSLDHEGGEHYRDFLDTVKFLFEKRGDEEVRALSHDLESFRKRLEEGSFVTEADAKLLELRSRLELRLRKVISRTERTWYIEEHGKGVEEVLPSGKGFAIPRVEELTDFIRLRRYLLDKVETTQHITEYWKSCPAPFTFMDAQYAAMAAARTSGEPMPPGLVAPARKLCALSGRSLRFRMLNDLVFGRANDRWKYLWARPSYTYYEDQFFGEADPRKVLVFSGWRFVPKAIALLTSNEAEQRIRPNGRTWTDDDQAPLRFTDKGSFHVFDVCCPSPALAGIIEPAALATEVRTAKHLLAYAERAVKAALAKADIEVGETSSASVWEMVARLEAARTPNLFDAMYGSRAYMGTDTTERFREHVDEFAEWGGATGVLRISRERLRHLAEIVAFSPASCLLRALWSMYPEVRGAVPPGIVDLCFTGLRTFFNKRQVRAIVEDAAPRKGYARSVLRYCELAHFQATADEYVFLLKEVLQRGDAVDAAEHLGRVLGIGTGTPNINRTIRLANGEERLHRAPLARRSHFALAFGEDVRGEQGSPLEGSFESRKTAVREAFNSPFWPFVLATTSVGQEGLDFHLFCRDIVHWNLPSNPVDLEQREGRINRRDGHAVRRSIARDWPLARVEKLARGPRDNTWRRVFSVIEQDPSPQQYKHGLYPHWVYDAVAGPSERIRRHLFFHENSQDARRYEDLKERLAIYRLVFGQPRQQDLLDGIQHRIEIEGDLTDLHRRLTRYMINLSPVRDRHAHERAWRDALEVVKTRETLEDLIADVEELERERGAELSGVMAHLQRLKNVIREHVAGRGGNEGTLRRAAYALSYLRNPYDAVFDAHENIGLMDDCEVVVRVAEQIGLERRKKSVEVGV
jgi:type III restriction/modification enzyme restriction subunit